MFNLGTGVALKSIMRTLVILWFAMLLLILREISALLSRINLSGQRSFGMDPLTGWHWLPWDARDIRAALELWQMADAEVEQSIRSWVGWHVVVDSLLIVSLVVLLHRVFRRLVNSGQLEQTWLMRVALVFYFVSDTVENVLTFLLVHRPTPSPIANITAVFTDLKWLSLGVCAAIIVAGMLVANAGPSYLRQALGVVNALRVPLVTVLILYVLLVVPGGGPLDQLPDIIRAETDQGAWWRVLLSWPSVMAVFFAMAIGLAALVETTSEPPQSNNAITPQPLGWKLPFWSLVALGVLMGLKWVLDRFQSRGPVYLYLSNGVFVLPVILLLGFLVALLFKHVQASPGTGQASAAGLVQAASGEPPSSGQSQIVGRALVAISIGAAGLAVVRAFTPAALVEESPGDNRSWLLVGILITFVAPLITWVIFAGIEKLLHVGDPKGRRAARITSWLVLVLGAVLAVVIALDPKRADFLRPHGVMFLVLGLGALSMVLIDTGRWSTAPGPIVRRLGLRTRPIILTALVVFVLAGQTDDLVRYHAARIDLPSAPPASAQQGSSWEAEVAIWKKQLQDCMRRHNTAPTSLPMVLVAAPGGGIRAAYWTGSAMAKLSEQQCGREQVFLASGVSGGSVGMAVWAATADVTLTKSKLSGMAGSQPLSRSLATMLLRDLPRGLVAVHPSWRDRAAVLEDGWSEATGSQRLNEQWGTIRNPSAGWTPHLVLNGTDVQRGCRVLITTLPRTLTVAHTNGQLNPQHCSTAPESPKPIQPVDSEAFATGSLDARDFASGPEPCRSPPGANVDKDMRIATAALLSARFPLVSPTGGLVSCSTLANEDANRVLVGDGGYRENSGLSTLLEVWRKLAPALAKENAASGPPIVPVFVLLDNHYRSAAVSKRLDRSPELRALGEGKNAAQHPASQGVLEQQTALIAAEPIPGRNSIRCTPVPELSEIYCSPRWYIIAPKLGPAPSAPLGWVLSAASRENLDDQLARSEINTLIPTLTSLQSTLR